MGRAREIHEEIAKQLSIGLSSGDLKTINFRTKLAAKGELAVDEWEWGREALQAALQAGSGEALVHAIKVGSSAKKALRQQVIVEAIKAANEVRDLMPFHLSIGKAAQELVRQLQNVRNDELPPPTIGSPGTSVPRAMALAAAKVYADHTGKPIPLGGMTREHVVAKLLQAVSVDIGKPGVLKPGHLKKLTPPSKK